MHAVLDGEATAEETRELQRALAADPAARSEFDELKRLFDELATVAMAYPPEGLVSSVMASLSQQARSEDGIRQPFTAPRVSGSNFRDAPDSGSGRSARDTGDSQQWPNFRSNKMSEQTSGSKRKIWIGGAIAAAAVVLVVSSGIDFPPGSKDTSGTIVPATRYKAPQNTAEDVKLGAPGSAQTTAPLAGDAAGNAAGNAATNASGNAVSNAAGNASGNAVTNAAGNASGNAVTNAAGNASGNAVTNASGNAVTNAAGNASGNAVTNASGNAVTNAAGNASGNAVTNAAGNASGNAVTNAAGNASGNAVTNAAGNASGNAVTNAAGNASGNAVTNAAQQK